MSRMSEVAEAYAKAKLAVMVGLGYLFWRKPAVAARIYSGLIYVLTKQAIKDTRMATGVIWRELAKPVLTEDAAIITVAAKTEWAKMAMQAPLYATTLFLTTGGAIAWSISNGYEALAEYLDWETPTNIDARID